MLYRFKNQTQMLQPVVSLSAAEQAMYEAQYRHYYAAVHLSSDFMSCNLAYRALLPWGTFTPILVSLYLFVFQL